MDFSDGTRVRNTVTGEIGTVIHGNEVDSEWGLNEPGLTVNVRYDKPLRGYSPQRDEYASALVPAE
jgi:hypothetical protein